VYVFLGFQFSRCFRKIKMWKISSITQKKKANEQLCGEWVSERERLYKQPQFFNWLEFPFWIFYTFYAGNTRKLMCLTSFFSLSCLTYRALRTERVSCYECMCVAAFVSTVSFLYFPSFEKKRKTAREKRKSEKSCNRRQA
jgi:hypothetical protein